VQTPSRGVCFEHVQNKRRRMAFAQRVRHRLQSVSTAFWRLHSAHLGDLQLFERFGNAVRTPLWCDKALKGICLIFLSAIYQLFIKLFNI